MGDFEEKRLFPRRNLALEVFVTDSGRRLGGTVEDITVHGISLALNEELSIGSKILIDLVGGGEIRKNEIQAEILRCVPRKDAATSGYLVAARFVDPNDEYLMDALAFVHGKNNPE